MNTYMKELAMLSGMILPPSTIETLKPETHEGENWIESMETRVLFNATAAPTEFEATGCEMAYTDDYHRGTPATPPKRLSGTAFNWQGGPTLSDTPTGKPAPVVVASQRIAAQPPKMSVRVSAFGQVAKFSDLPIAA